MPIEAKEHIDKIQDEIIQEFELFDDNMGKYQYLIDLGKDLKEIDASLKVEDNIIKGCQSRVWLHAEYKDGRVYYQAESDALIVKGLVALLLRVFSGQKAEDIVNSENRFIDEIGLHRLLSPTRSNGLASMVKQMKYYAIAFSHKS